MKFTFEATIDGLAKAMATLEEALDGAGCPMSAKTKLMVAMDEVASNIVHYSGATDFDGFTIYAKTISSYDRELFQLDPSDREAGYGLRVSRTETADGVRLAVSIAERGGMMMIVK